MPPPSSASWKSGNFGNNFKKKLLQTRTCFLKVALKRPSSDSAVLSQLRECEKKRAPRETFSLSQLIRRSSKFVPKFPCQNIKTENLIQKLGISEERLEHHMHSVYPIIHHTCLDLLVNFLQHKRLHGYPVERSMYAKMDILKFVDRLLKKRPMSFLGANDKYLLPPPSRLKGSGGFEAIGTDDEQAPLLLGNFLSYDEMRVSALLSMSSWSCFINDGRRKNFGAVDDPVTFQAEGVIVGQVGARLKKEGVMEYVDCMVTRYQNNADHGFGDANLSHINSVWSKFWGGVLPTFQDAKDCLQVQQGGQRASQFEYLAIGKDIFNITVFKKRIAITADILLCEANTRAKASRKRAYVHVVGLGLGVWRAFPEEDELFVEAWGDAIKNITNLSHIAFVDFSYINCFSIHGTKNNQKFPGTDIIIKFSKRNLHDKVPQNCMLICNYAWDGNALPGNEFWMGKLCSTGDSAAACSSCIAEIHNPFINPVVSGMNLHIADSSGHVLDWSDYLKYLEKKGPSPTEEANLGSCSSSDERASSTDISTLVIRQHVGKSLKRSSDSGSSQTQPSPKKVKLNRKPFE